MPLPLPTDSGYSSLLIHLRQRRTSLSFETIQTAICHYLVHLPPTHPTPTPLTASVFASSIWRTLSSNKTQEFALTFRKATLLKYSSSESKSRGLLDISASVEFSRWVRDVLAGSKGGDCILVMALSGGILQALRDLKKSDSHLYCDVEKKIVLATAEALERLYPIQTDTSTGWEKEFHSETDETNGRSYLVLLLAAQYFPLVASETLAALRIADLVNLCLSLIQRTFFSGQFLDGAPASVVRSTNGLVSILPKSRLREDMYTLMSSDSFVNVAAFCKFIARSVTIISESWTRPHQRRELWKILADISHLMEMIATNVESAWLSCLFSDTQNEEDVDIDSRELTQNLWVILKTLLFSTIVLHQSILDTTMFLPSMVSFEITSLSLSKSILRTLSALSFIIATFGGVTAVQEMKDLEEGRGFPELKRVFYMAMDILSTNAKDSEEFVKELTASTNPNQFPIGNSRSNSKRAYILACIEQLVPVLSESCIEDYVLPFCQPHLGNPSHRETFESSHSVMLSIFASDGDTIASASTREKVNNDRKGKPVLKREQDLDLSTRIIPGYVKSLLENAKDGKLTTPQFRLAYAALVRNAGASKASRIHFTGQDTKDSSPLAWFCVNALLDAIHLATLQDRPNAETANENKSRICEDIDEHSTERIKLQLALISLIHNVPLSLLPHILQEIEHMIDEEDSSQHKATFINSVFDEISDKAGDGEKEYAMRWWYERCNKWRTGVLDEECNNP